MLLYVLSIVAVITCSINFFVIFQKMWFSSNCLQVGKYAHLSGVHHSPFILNFILPDVVAPKKNDAQLVIVFDTDTENQKCVLKISYSMSCSIKYAFF